MTTYIKLCFKAPLQSWGTHTFENRRPSELSPTRSALTGIIAAAMGVDRNETDKLREIDRSYRYAVRGDERVARIRGHSRPRILEPKKVVDFHMVQNVRTTKNDPKCTKSEMTYREYVENAEYTLFLTSAPGAVHSLSSIAKYLSKPVFEVYFGRRSCVPARPLVCYNKDGDVLFEAESFYDAFLQHAPGTGLILCDDPIGLPKNLVPLQRNVYIRDAILFEQGSGANQNGRKFLPRRVYCFRMGKHNIIEEADEDEISTLQDEIPATEEIFAMADSAPLNP